MKPFVTPAGTIAGLAALVSKHTGIGLALIFSESKKRGPARARMLTMFLARKLTSLSLEEIGEQFDRDHSTVVNACQRVEAALVTDSALQAIVAALEGTDLSAAPEPRLIEASPSSCSPASPEEA